MGDLVENLEKRKKSRNAIYRVPTKKKVERARDDGQRKAGKRIEREKTERVRVLQITNPPKKPGARYTKTFSAGPNASHGANDAPPRRGTQVGHTGVGVHYNQIPKKGEKN